MDTHSYTKIETIFQRDMNGSKKIIPGAYCSEEVEVLKDLDWEWTEKIDGTNIRVLWDGYRVSFLGRNEKSTIPKPLLEYLTRTFGGDENEQIFEQKFGEKTVMLCGEGYGDGIQLPESYRADTAFILFDVQVNGFWLKREAIEDVAKAFNIEVVPVIMQGSVEKAIEFVKAHPKSEFSATHGRDIFMEGLVGKAPCGLNTRSGKRIMVKVKWKDFKHFV